MNPQQLRNIRETKGLTLAGLQDKIGVREQVLAAIERGAFRELPSGLYGRHAVRAYAGALGINPDALIEEVGPLLPAGEDPLDGLARVRGFARRRDVPDVRLKPDTTQVRLKPDTTRAMQIRVAAASAIDGAILAIFSIVLFQLTALSAGLPVAEATARAGPIVGAIMALIGSLYFILLGGLRQATFGQAIAQVRGEPASHGRDLQAVVANGVHCALRESSIVVELYRSRYTRSRPELNASGRSIGCSVTR
jgi:transcriptional regulator with XRE-family HTH domain